MDMRHSSAVLSARPWDNASQWEYQGSKGQRSFWKVMREGKRFHVCVMHADRLTFTVWVFDRSRAKSLDTREDAEKAMYRHIACTDERPVWQVNTFDPYADKGKRHAFVVFLREADAGAYARGCMAKGHIERVKATVHEVSGIAFRDRFKLF